MIYLTDLMVKSMRVDLTELVVGMFSNEALAKIRVLCSKPEAS